MNFLITQNEKTKNKRTNRLNEKEFKNIKKRSITIFLDNIRSMHNVGSAFRTADAFLVEKLYLGGITATPPHNDIRKNSSRS